MKAAVITEFGKPFEIKDVPKPKIGPNEVLVRIEASGFCHSDLHAAKGDWPSVVKLLKTTGVKILGHEGVGKVVEIGESVRNVNIGDRVGVSFIHSTCGICEPCLTGHEVWCEDIKFISRHVDGTFAEYTKVSGEWAIPIPEGIPDDEAPALLCAGITSYSAVKKLITQGITPGKKIAIIGAAGGLGHYAVQIAKVFGYKVVGIDVGEEKVSTIKKLGADFAIDAKDVEQFIKEEGKVSAAIVVAPTIAAYEMAFNSVKKVGVVVVVGIPPEAQGSLPITPRQHVGWGTRIIPSYIGTRQEFRELFSLYLDRKVKSLVTIKEPLEKINDIMERMEKGIIIGRGILTI